MKERKGHWDHVVGNACPVDFEFDLALRIAATERLVTFNEPTKYFCVLDAIIVTGFHISNAFSHVAEQRSGFSG